MKLSASPAFLATNVSNEGETVVSIHRTFVGVMQEWSLATRISPIWGLSQQDTLSDPNHVLPLASGRICFLGTIHPRHMLNDLPKVCKNSQLFLSLGLYNVIVGVPDSSHSDQILQWCNEQNVPCEIWHMVDGLVVENQHWPTYETLTKTDWRLGKAIAQKASGNGCLAFSLREYASLIFQARARCRRAWPTLLPLINRIDDFLSCEVKKLTKEGDPDFHALFLHVQALLVNINAGLSRFTSQAFSGTSPIVHTESHYWYHSLLGIGMANRALVSLVRFIGDIIGETGISEALLLTSLINKDNISNICSKREIPNLGSTGIADDIFSNDNIKYINEWSKSENHDGERLLQNFLVRQQGSETAPRNKSIMPIVFFSGRDGFRSHHLTLSAPLNAIGGCNSLQWSLLTISHEICHSFVRTAMEILYVRPDDQIRVVDTLALIKNDQLDNLLQALRRLMAQVVVCLEMAERKIADPHDRQDTTFYAKPSQFARLLNKWHNRIEELMVHILDFSYFYDSNAENYVQGIWASWGVIPNVEDRIEDYVLRTITAVTCNYLKQGDSRKIVEMARNEVLQHLQEMKSGKGSNHNVAFLDDADDYIKRHWDTYLFRRAIATLELVKLVRGFLFSESVRIRIRSEKAGNKTWNRGILGDGTIENPLLFVRDYQRLVDPNERESIWMLATLALNYEMAVWPRGMDS